MTNLKYLLRIIGLSVSLALLYTAGGLSIAGADSVHARIVRLSLVQGDVRFTRDAKGDPLGDSRSGWEGAVLNLPIRQGYVLATDAGRAEVEFENGAMAFLAENTVLEFYDLSSEDGGFTTRLILRQGSAEFYVNPSREDYFSVTGGDFSVQADGKTTFRMNNYDDGSNVNVLRGHLTAIVNGKDTVLDKNQSLSLRAGQPDSMSIERIPGSDDFDQWVAGRIETAITATNAGQQYANTYSGYSSGFGDLYTYGAWFPVAGYGYCWRPYGVGFGWSPFDYGSWYYDPFFGWSYIGGQPWGWLPYHYGGWLFRPGVGWVWSPSGSFGSGGVGRWKPVTGTWMKAGNSVGIVPTHPLDVKGKPPLNMGEGLFAVTTRGVTGKISVVDGSKWKVESKPSRDIMQSQLAAVGLPERIARTMGSSGRGGATESGGAIVYDRAERKFVNANSAQSAARTAAENNGVDAQAPNGRTNQNDGRSTATPQVPASNRVSGLPTQSAALPAARSTTPTRPTVAPPSVPRSVVTERVFSEGSRGSSGSASGGGSSRGTSAAPSPSSSTSSSHTSSGSGGGGRPH